MPSTTTSTSYSLDGNSCVTCWWLELGRVRAEQLAQRIVDLDLLDHQDPRRQPGGRPGSRPDRESGTGSSASRSAPRATPGLFSAARAGNDGVSYSSRKSQIHRGAASSWADARRPFYAPAGSAVHALSRWRIPPLGKREEKPTWLTTFGRSTPDATDPLVPGHGRNFVPLASASSSPSTDRCAPTRLDVPEQIAEFVGDRKARTRYRRPRRTWTAVAPITRPAPRTRCRVYRVVSV